MKSKEGSLHPKNQYAYEETRTKHIGRDTAIACIFAIVFVIVLIMLTMK